MPAMTGPLAAVGLRAAAFDEAFRARFWAKTERAGECIEWRGGVGGGGYGITYHQYRQIKSHRVAFTLRFGDTRDHIEKVGPPFRHTVATEDKDICLKCGGGAWKRVRNSRRCVACHKAYFRRRNRNVRGRSV